MSFKSTRFFTEPIIQFLFLGTVLFLLVSYFQKKTDRKAGEIYVSNEQVNLIILNYKTQTGNFPLKQQMDAMIDNYIKEEIAYREAKKMGLDKDDEIIRRRLVQKFDFLQTDLTELPTPSEPELQEFYSSQPELFRLDATVSFSHIFFNANNSTDSIASKRAQTVLTQISAPQIHRAPEMGDRFPLQFDYFDQSMLDIQQNFGNKPILTVLFNAPLKTWIGPVQSGYGWHLLYISKRDTARVQPYSRIKEEVKTAFLNAQRATQNRKTADLLRQEYSIQRAYLESK